MTFEKLWEYKALNLEADGFMFSEDGTFDSDSMTKQLNRLGAEGWELVCNFDANPFDGATRNVILVFKRHPRSRD